VTPPITPSGEDALAERLIHSATGALEMFGVYLGVRLGLYESLATRGPLTADELARAAEIAPRYAREWLEHQAVAGLLQLQNAGAPEADRRYALPPSHAAVLADPDHPAHCAPLSLMLAGIGAVLPRVVEAYRTGAPVPYEAYGRDFRDGQAGINRPAFLQDLVSQWLPALPDVHARLQRGEPLRIADAGCGVGWAAIALASAYPNASVVGYDLDAASIEDARRNAAERGAPARFERRDLGELAGEGPFDLVLLLEALHDMAHPVESLSALRGALAPHGVLFVADERVHAHFQAPGDPLERLMYGWSIVHCLPTTMSNPDEAIGTAIRPSTIERLAMAAGFARSEVLPTESSFFRFYRLEAA
jgi:SAM-dependent methyltransferase